MIGVDRHVVGDTFEPSSFDGDAAVAFAVGELVEHVRQVGSGHLGQSAEDAGIPDQKLEAALELISPFAGQEAAIAGQDMIGTPRGAAGD